jgi:hypothetical protein
MLGFLNQSEWIQNLNIGNIMQISVIEAEDFLAWHRNDQEIDRVSFLQTISHLIVSYFCLSTEIRFLIQLREELSLFKEFSIEAR